MEFHWHPLTEAWQAASQVAGARAGKYLVDEDHKSIEDIHLDILLSFPEAGEESLAGLWIENAESIKVITEDRHHAFCCCPTHFPARIVIIRILLIRHPASKLMHQEIPKA